MTYGTDPSDANGAPGENDPLPPAHPRIDRAIAALWTFGPPSGITLDPDSQRIVAYAAHAAAVDLARQIGDDEQAMKATCAAIRAAVAAKSTDPYDRGQGERICRALYRGWLVARVNRHPRAGNFRTLLEQISKGRATDAQLTLARRLAREVR